jgi:hypothetical protein
MATIKITVKQQNFNIKLGKSVLVGASAENTMLLTGDQTAAGNKTFTDNVTVEGNLTVKGEVNFIESNTLNVGDNIITLNADISDTTAPTEDAGIQVKRGTEPVTGIYWRENDDKWKIDEYTIAKDGDTLDGGTF